MKARRLLPLLAAVLITSGQTLIFAVDTASTAYVAAPQEAYLTLHPAAGRQT